MLGIQYSVWISVCLNNSSCEKCTHCLTLKKFNRPDDLIKHHHHHRHHHQQQQQQSQCHTQSPRNDGVSHCLLIRYLDRFSAKQPALAETWRARRGSDRSLGVRRHLAGEWTVALKGITIAATILPARCVLHLLNVTDDSIGYSGGYGHNNSMEVIPIGLIEPK